MGRILALAVAAVFGLSACGASEEGEPLRPPVSPEPGEALPDVARIICKVDGPPVVDTPAVRPQPDGVHLEIRNETGTNLTLVLPTRGTGAPKGTSTQIVDLGPGDFTIACQAPDDLADVEPPAAALGVVDESGVWVSDVLDCPEQFSQVIDYATDARGDTADPLEAARKAVEGYGLEPGDVFEKAGYPAADGARVRLVRDGEPLAVVFLVDDGTGKWLVDGLNGYSSLADSRR
jgi:hypothetical protein